MRDGWKFHNLFTKYYLTTFYMLLIQNEDDFKNLLDISEKARENEDLVTAIEGYKRLLSYRLQVIFWGY